MFGYLASLEHRRESRILRRLERASADEVQQYADERLSEMLLWCKRRVPYYRRHLKTVGDRHIHQRPAQVLADLPALKKPDLHNHFEELVAKGRAGARVRRNATGGSTGETAQFLQDLAYRRWNRAVLAHFESWTGWKPGDSKVTLWGIPRDVESSARPVHRIRDWLLERMTLNAYNLSAQTMTQYIDVIRRARPQLLRVFTQSGAELARHMLSSGEDPLPVDAVTCSGAMLLDRYRKDMTAAFGAEVYDSYGSREVGPMAAERDPASGLLVSPATHRLEIIRADGVPAAPGEEGEIHVTLLSNRVMPLIRYRIGDRGAWAENQLRDNEPAWPRIGCLVGRTMEHVVAADGTLRNSQLMSELVMHVDWIRRFQWVQETRERIELRAEPHDGHPVSGEAERLEADLAAQIRRIIGPECRLEITLSDRIEPSPSGKYHYVICKVA